MPDSGVDGFDLCLSGGGFRATLFGLGVILYLRACKRLGNIQHIYAVSGGAILAAHLIERWSGYSNIEEKYVSSAVRRLLMPILWTSFRNRAIAISGLLWLLPAVLLLWSAWSRHLPWAAIAAGAALMWMIYLTYHPPVIWAAQWLYRWSFGLKTRWGKIQRHAPRLHLLATDMLTGRLAEFSPDGFRLHPAVVSDGLGIRAKNRPLAVAVAASAAFPPLFPPLVIRKDNETAVLTDGGVFDNLGIEARGDNARPCIVVDAGRQFVNLHDGIASRFVVPRNTRASDISMNRLAERDLSRHPSYKSISIRETKMATEALPEEVRVEIPRIRTDLNRFTRAEMQALVMHGADVAGSVLGLLSSEQREEVYSILRFGLGMRRGEPLEIQASQLAKSDQLSFWPLWWMGLLYLCVLCVAVHLLGDLPQLAFGASANAWQGSPLFRPVTPDAQQLTAAIEKNHPWEEYWTRMIGTKEGVYYQSTNFWGPLYPTQLSLPAPQGINQGEDAFALLVPDGREFREKLWLNTHVRDGKLIIEVPDFTGKAQIWLFVTAQDKLDGDSSWSNHSEVKK